MEECIFCNIIRGETPSYEIYEDKYVLAFLDVNPLNEGHTLVTPKEHIERLEELDKKGGNTFKTVHKIAPKIAKAVEAPAYNIFINNGKEAGQEIPHVHYHILPRYKDDGSKGIDSIVESSSSIDEKELDETQNKIKKEI